MIKVLDISFSELPISKIFTFDGIDYIFSFFYNERFDFISVSVSKDEILLNSNKLIYGQDIFPNLRDLPALVPLSEIDFNSDFFSDIRVNKSTFGSSVKIYFDDGT